MKNKKAIEGNYRFENSDSTQFDNCLYTSLPEAADNYLSDDFPDPDIDSFVSSGFTSENDFCHDNYSYPDPRCMTPDGISLPECPDAIPQNNHCLLCQLERYCLKLEELLPLKLSSLFFCVERGDITMESVIESFASDIHRISSLATTPLYENLESNFCSLARFELEQNVSRTDAGFIRSEYIKYRRLYHELLEERRKEELRLKGLNRRSITELRKLIDNSDFYDLQMSMERMTAPYEEALSEIGQQTAWIMMEYGGQITDHLEEFKENGCEESILEELMAYVKRMNNYLISLPYCYPDFYWPDYRG